MKSVLISIQPKWCEFIASGKKTIEVRKSKPKLDTPFKCYIYCTKSKSYFARKHPSIDKAFGGGMVIGEFVCDYIISHCEMANADIAEQQGCIKREELFKYANGKELYGWHISDLVIYDKPRELGEFKRFCVGVSGKIGCRGCKYFYEENDESQGHFEMCGCDNIRPLERPFQSWGYVYEAN